MIKRIFLAHFSVLFLLACLTGCGDTGIADVNSSLPATTSKTQNTVSYNDLAERFTLESIYPTKPNSAGGVTVVIMYKNHTDEDIKYLTFNVAPYNAVDDMVASEIGNKSEVTLKVTGPIPKGDTYYVDFKNTWYNPTIKYVVVSSIEIEYMNGDVIVCDKDIPIDKRDKKQS